MSLLESNTEALERLMEEVNNLPDPGSGDGTFVQTDWDQYDNTEPDFLKNKPFGEFRGDTLTWTIDFTKIDIDSLPGGYFCKVSDTIITMADLTNGCTIDLFGEPLPVAPEEIIDLGEGVVALPELLAVFIDESGVGVDVEGLAFPESGIYVIIELSNGYLTIPGFARFVATRKMNSKYLPDSVSTRTVFFTDDQYLYKDAELTKKVQAAEIVGLIRDNQNVVIYDISTLSTAVFIGTSRSYGFVVYFTKRGNESLETKVAYTAEYTPE